MANSIETAVATVKPMIDALIQSSQACEGAVCSQRDAIMEILEKAGHLVYRQKIHPMHVLCHDMNRSGQGLDPARCIKLMETIANVGFSHELTAAIAFEIPPTGPRRDAIEAFNARMAAASNDILAPVDAGIGKVASVAGSHLSGGLRAICFGMSSDNPVISSHGKLSAAKIGEKDNAFKDVLEHGVEYTVIRWQVEAAFGSLPDMFQEVGNIGGHIHSGESYVSVLLKIVSRAASLAQGGQEIDWDLVQRLVLRSCPPNPTDVPMMCQYVAHWSGSASNPYLLHDLQEYTRSLRSARSIRGPIFGALADLNFGVGKGGRFRTAVLKACASAEERFCNTHGECIKLLASSDIASLAVGKKNHAIATQAEAVMMKAMLCWFRALQMQTSQIQTSRFAFDDCGATQHHRRRERSSSIAMHRTEIPWQFQEFWAL